MIKKTVGILLFILLILSAIYPVTGKLDVQYTILRNVDSEPIKYDLPPPMTIDMVLEESMCRRMSVRSFTSEAVTDEELSTILWAAYGFADNGDRTVFSPDEVYPAIIYVIRSDATYKYVPEDHSLSLFKTGIINNK